MTEAKGAELLLAIDGVTQAIERMDARIASLDALERAAKEARTKRLDALVRDAIPEISPTVIARLRTEYPSFASRTKVESAFRENRKVLGLFKRSTYDLALLVLKTELKAYLESAGAAKVQEEEMQQASAERSRLYEQRQEAMGVLKSLERMLRSGSKIQEAEKDIVKHLATKGRAMGQARVDRRFVGPASQMTNHQHTMSWQGEGSTSNASDLWIWMLTDVPTSVRTLVGSMVAQSHRSDTHVASEGTWSSREEPNVFETARLKDAEEKSWAPQSLQCASDDSSPAIATDDSLGRFS